MKIRKPKFTPYALGIIAILEGGGHIDAELEHDGFWACLLYDVDHEYMGMVPRPTVARLLQTGKASLEHEDDNLRVYVATEPINEL